MTKIQADIAMVLSLQILKRVGHVSSFAEERQQLLLISVDCPANPSFDLALRNDAQFDGFPERRPYVCVRNEAPPF